VAPWASLKNEAIDFSFEDHNPVDLELEGFDQIRGWWNSQFITSHMTYDQRPFDNVIYHGKVMLDGEEMSKSRGIVVSPEEAIGKYGRDILRFFLLSNDPSDDLNFTWDGMDENMEFMNILWNTYNYKDTYTEERERPENLELEDEWILSRLNTVIEEAREHSTEPNYEGFKAAQLIEDFTKNDLSRGYIKMIRDRLKPGYDGDDRAAAEWTLRHVTDELLKVLSPFTPYLTDYLYEGGEDSIHFEAYPEADEEMVDEELERSMDIFQDIEEAVARLRQEKGIKLRHPVKKVTVSGSAEVEKAVQNLEDLLKDRLNAKQVKFEKVELDYEVKLDYAEAGPELGDSVGEVETALNQADQQEIAEKVEGGLEVELAGHKLSPEMFEIRTHVPEGMEGEEFSSGTVYIDDEMTEKLEEEAFVAEVIRAVQQKRKEAGLNVEDKVQISFKNDTGPVEKREDQIRNRMNVSEISYGSDNLEFSDQVEFRERKIQFSFSRPN
jgi:isoleucyl-tRNA synthetase